MYNTIQSTYKTINNKTIKIYLFNNESISKKELLQHIKFMVDNNNNLFYKQLKENGFDYKKVDNILLDYKQVKNDILNNGLIYHFKIEL